MNCAEPECLTWSAGAWTSPDGVTWTAATVGHGSGATLTDVSWNGNAYFALGIVTMTKANGTVRASAGIWRSPDGHEWAQISSVYLGQCHDGCPGARLLSVSQNGVIVIGNVIASAIPNGIYRSTDGTPWTRVKLGAASGLPLGLRPDDVIAAEPGTVLVGSHCQGCPVTVWGSADGATWREIGATGGPEAGGVQITTDGVRLVVAQEACPDNKPCTTNQVTTTLWSAVEGEPLTQNGSEIQLFFPHLAFAGVAFVLVGQWADGVRLFTSADGLIWEEHPASIPLGRCVISALVGGPHQALLVLAGDAVCSGMWVSREG